MPRLFLGLFLVGAAAIGTQYRHADAATNVTVTINGGSVLGTLPQGAFGANTAAWDGDLTDGALPGLLRNAGIRVLRYPGGSTSDNYHWQTNTQSNGGYTNPSDTFDNFMSVVQQIGGQPVITVNYGSGSASEAAGWVNYANVTKHYGIKYWEIGNEVYGNGSYSGAWETDQHAQKGPAAYASNAMAFSDAMKAADPSIKVGMVLTAPGNWPDGQSPDWNSTVLSTACAKMDFGIIHWYPQGPGSESDASLLSSTSQIAGMIGKLHAEYAQYCGARAGQIETLVTEVNSVSSSPGKQTVSQVNGLFLADTYMGFLEQGVSNIDWWDLHNGMSTGTNISPSLYGNAQYGDYGLFSFGSSSGSISEPPNETPFPSYYGMQMLSHLGAPGDQMVQATSNQSLVAVHAVKQANGDLAVLLINKDPGATYNISLALSGYAPAGTATSYTYGENSSSITSSTVSGVGSGFSQAVAPYSLTVLVLVPSGNTLPTNPSATTTTTPVSTNPTATATPAGTSTTNTGTMSFSQQTSLSAASTMPNGSVSITTLVTNTGSALSNGVVDLEIYNSAGQQVGQRAFSAQSLSAGQSAPYSWSWTAPAQSGTYTVKVGVFGSSWNPLYYWANAAATIAVGSGSQPATATATTPPATATQVPSATATNTPVPTVSPNLPPATATITGASTNMSFAQQTSAMPALTVPNGSVSIRTMVINTGAALNNGTVNVGIANSSGQQVGQQLYNVQSLGAGQSALYTWTWTAPAQSGAYTVKVGVFGPSSSTPYYSANSAAAIIVVSRARSAAAVSPAHVVRITARASRAAAPAGMRASRASFTQVTTLSSGRVAPSAHAIIHATITNTGGALSNGVVDLEIVNAAGRQVGQRIFIGQSLAAGQSASYSWQWTAPIQGGTYTVKVGVFGSAWSPLYFWAWQAAHIAVA